MIIMTAMRLEGLGTCDLQEVADALLGEPNGAAEVTRAWLLKFPKHVEEIARDLFPGSYADYGRAVKPHLEAFAKAIKSCKDARGHLATFEEARAGALADALGLP